MCGFAGIARAAGSNELRSEAERLAATLTHRGPDDAGSWCSPDGTVALAFRRLAILDLSPTGHQPMRSPDGRHAIAFNGEIYDHRRLRSHLERDGHRFRGTSDTEVLLTAVGAWGLTETLRRANGMFALAVWDRDEGTVSLARDRLGEKPLYYTDLGDEVVFASELKALRRHPRFDSGVDPAALDAYLRRGFLPAGLTIHPGTRMLAPGSVLTIDVAQGGRRVSTFWDLDTVVADGLASDPVDVHDATDELESLLLDAVDLRLQADVPLGAFLSGGLDSSLIAALASARSSRPVSTFAVAFGDASHDESAHAAAVARHLGTDHHTLHVDPSAALDLVPELPTIHDEPFGDPSAIPTALICRAAREHVTVCLSGDGGDEVFGGYNRYTLSQRVWERLGAVPSPGLRAAGGLLSLLPITLWDDAVRHGLVRGELRQRNLGDKVQKLGAMLSAGRHGAYRSLAGVWPEPPLATGTRADAAWPVTRQDLDPVRSMMLADQVVTLPDDMLTKVDRASMAASLEVRVPLLDHRLVELSWRLPTEQLVSGGRGKLLLRRVLDRYVPAELVDRPKMGFDPPIGAWLRGPLRAWAEDHLSPGVLSGDGLLEPDPIRDRWTEHLSGRRNWDYQLWTVLMYVAWREQLRVG